MRLPWNPPADASTEVEGLRVKGLGLVVPKKICIGATIRIQEFGGLVIF